MITQIPVEKLKTHALAESLVPPLSEGEFALLKRDIAAAGIRTPLDVIPAGDGGDYVVTDGVHRLKAARDLGLKKVPAYVRAMSEEDVEAHVFRQAFYRRNLTPGQKAAVAAEWVERQGGDEQAVSRAVRLFGLMRSSVETALLVKSRSPQAFSFLRNGSLSVTEAKSFASDMSDSSPKFYPLSPEFEKTANPRLKEILQTLPPTAQEALKSVSSSAEPATVAAGNIEEIQDQRFALEKRLFEAAARDLKDDELKQKLSRALRERDALENLVKIFYSVSKTSLEEKIRAEQEAFAELSPPYDQAGRKELTDLLENCPNVDPIPPLPDEALEKKPDPDAVRVEQLLLFLLSALRSKETRELMWRIRSAAFSQRAARYVSELFDEIDTLLTGVRTALTEHALGRHAAPQEMRGQGSVLVMKRMFDEGLNEH